MSRAATPRQQEVARSVLAAWLAGRAHYRADGSGERVTLASLYRAGVVARRAWRGQDGEADAAYEYRPSDEFLAEVGHGLVAQPTSRTTD